MKNITIIELQEEQLDNINAASAGSFFKKIGKGLGKGLGKVGRAIMRGSDEVTDAATHMKEGTSRL